MRAVQLLLGPSKLESTVHYLGIEVDDALEISGQTEIWRGLGPRGRLFRPNSYITAAGRGGCIHAAASSNKRIWARE